MFLDLILALAHHLLIFMLAGTIAAELALLRPGLAGREIRLLGRIDALYGMTALLVIVVGVLRVFLGLKGWDYYAYSVAFWAKIAAFATVGALSAPPTLRILSWRRAAAGTAGIHIVPEAEIAAARRYLKAEAAVFPLILVFAAAMARGY